MDMSNPRRVTPAPIPFPRDAHERVLPAPLTTEALRHEIIFHEQLIEARKEGYEQGWHDATGAEFWIGTLCGMFAGGCSVALMFVLRAWASTL